VEDDSYRMVWDPGIIFSFSLEQSMEHKVMMELLENKQSLEGRICQVPIFWFFCFVLEGTFVACQWRKRCKKGVI
jgi:hypothetical protein